MVDIVSALSERRPRDRIKPTMVVAGAEGGDCSTKKIRFGKRVRGNLEDDGLYRPRTEGDGRPISIRSPARVVTVSTSQWTAHRCRTPT